jgi:hypothetical protein
MKRVALHSCSAPTVRAKSLTLSSSRGWAYSLLIRIGSRVVLWQGWMNLGTSKEQPYIYGDADPVRECRDDYARQKRVIKLHDLDNIIRQELNHYNDEELPINLRRLPAANGRQRPAAGHRRQIGAAPVGETARGLGLRLRGPAHLAAPGCSPHRSPSRPPSPATRSSPCERSFYGEQGPTAPVNS